MKIVDVCRLAELGFICALPRKEAFKKQGQVKPVVTTAATLVYQRSERARSNLAPAKFRTTAKLASDN